MGHLTTKGIMEFEVGGRQATAAGYCCRLLLQAAAGGYCCRLLLQATTAVQTMSSGFIRTAICEQALHSQNKVISPNLNPTAFTSPSTRSPSRNHCLHEVAPLQYPLSNPPSASFLAVSFHVMPSHASLCCACCAVGDHCALEAAPPPPREPHRLLHGRLRAAAGVRVHAQGTHHGKALYIILSLDRKFMR